jgi:hypothetical protein
MTQIVSLDEQLSAVAHSTNYEGNQQEDQQNQKRRPRSNTSDSDRLAFEFQTALEEITPSKRSQTVTAIDHIGYDYSEYDTHMVSPDDFMQESDETDETAQYEMELEWQEHKMQLEMEGLLRNEECSLYASQNLDCVWGNVDIILNNNTDNTLMT